MTDEREQTEEEAPAEVMDAGDRLELHEANARMDAAIAALDDALTANPELRALRDRVQTAVAVREQVVKATARRYRLGPTDLVREDGVIVRGE